MHGIEKDFDIWPGDVVWLCTKTMAQDYTGMAFDEQALALIHFSGHAEIRKE